MSWTGVEPKHRDVNIEQLKEKDTLHSEILVNKELMTDAFLGEDAEHSQTVWQAVKSHKMACFWAFVMCFTMCVLISASATNAPIAGFDRKNRFRWSKLTGL